MKEFIEILNYLGLSVTDSTSPIILFLCWISLFNILALLNVFYILIYVGVLYLLEDKTRLDKVKYYLPRFINPYFDRIVNYYKTIRIIYIWIDVVFLLFILTTLITTLYKLIYYILLM